MKSRNRLESFSQDPSGLGPDSNPYRYVRNQPTMLADPSGLEPPPKIDPNGDEPLHNQDRTRRERYALWLKSLEEKERHEYIGQQIRQNTGRLDMIVLDVFERCGVFLSAQGHDDIGKNLVRNSRWLLTTNTTVDPLGNPIATGMPPAVGPIVGRPRGPLPPLRYPLGVNDKDWRRTGKTLADALNDAFERTGLAQSQFVVTKWGKDKYGKSHPVEWRHECGAEVNIDWPHLRNGPDAPHVGWQTGGKRGSGGAVRGHTLIDDVPYNRPTIR